MLQDQAKSIKQPSCLKSSNIFTETGQLAILAEEHSALVKVVQKNQPKASF